MTIYITNTIWTNLSFESCNIMAGTLYRWFLDIRHLKLVLDYLFCATALMAPTCTSFICLAWANSNYYSTCMYQFNCSLLNAFSNDMNDYNDEISQNREYLYHNIQILDGVCSEISYASLHSCYEMIGCSLWRKVSPYYVSGVYSQSAVYPFWTQLQTCLEVLHLPAILRKCVKTYVKYEHINLIRQKTLFSLWLHLPCLAAQRTARSVCSAPIFCLFTTFVIKHTMAMRLQRHRKKLGVNRVLGTEYYII